MLLARADVDPGDYTIQFASRSGHTDIVQMLLARDDATGALISAERLETLGHYREPLNRGEIGIADFLRSAHGI